MQRSDAPAARDSTERSKPDVANRNRVQWRAHQCLSTKPLQALLDGREGGEATGVKLGVKVVSRAWLRPQGVGLRSHASAVH